ncbi:cupin domain-containing protein [Gymnodinialimonas sp. 2305UL16-5]|uniref:cupin domain-containing protein n=1 Tax=Gymnodinialimonas mytili TaxID=3126503 RepID=UPI0030B40B4E
MPRVDYPKIEEGEDEIGRFRAELLSDAGGLTQFGAFVETLWPGGASSKLHWHRSEDEMIYVLDGVVTLIEGDGVTDLHAGQAATFKAGVAVGHRLENRSDMPVRYFVVGTRSGDDVVTYSETGESVTIKDGEKVYRDADGNITKVEPYHGA